MLEYFMKIDLIFINNEIENGNKMRKFPKKTKCVLLAMFVYELGGFQIK